MATITGMTAAAMIAIRDQMIVGAEINGSGHLIFTLFDESTVDAGSLTAAVGAASTTVSGTVELATTGETTTGTDDVRAVTPAGLLAVSSTKQPLDDDLTAIANLTPENDDFVQRKSGLWANRTLAQVSSDLSATLMPKAGGTFTGDVVVTGANFNGASNQTMGAFTTYTPSWTSSGTAPNPGNGVLVGRYSRVGRMITCIINFIPGSTTTYGTGNYSFALPAAAASSGATPPGRAELLGSARWAGQVPVASGQSTVSPFFPTSSSDNRLSNMTPSGPETFANGSQLRMILVYEAAS